MIGGIKRWWRSSHRWTSLRTTWVEFSKEYPGESFCESSEYRICKFCGQEERRYDWEGASWWGILNSGDPTKPCRKRIVSHISPPY